MNVPDRLLTGMSRHVLRLRGDSMISAGVQDGDYVVVEQRDHARIGEIVLALVDNDVATLKRIEQRPGVHPVSPAREPMSYPSRAMQILGVVGGKMRKH